MKYILKVSLTLIIVLILQGCTNVKEGLSLKKQGVDEFLIERKNPLTVPPDFSTLPKPRNSMDENKVKDKDIDLKKVLTETAKDNSVSSSGNIEKSISEILNKK